MSLRAVSASTALAALILASGTAQAQRAPANAAPVLAPKAEKFEVDSENIFGFTEGSDTNEQGEKEVTFGMLGRFIKRGKSDPLLPPQTPVSAGRYAAVSPFLGLEYGITDDLGVELTGFASRHVIRNVPEMDNINRSGFDGLEFNVKYRLLERTKDNPFGFAVVGGPRWARFDENEGARMRAFGGEFKALFDWRLLDGRLWYAANLGLEVEGGREKSSRAFERGSTFLFSQALTARLFGETFGGIEMRYLRAYDGLMLKQFSGDALYLGPTFFQKFGKKAFVSAAWGIAVAGKSRDPANAPGQKLNLSQFSRHIVQLKAGIEF